MASNKTKHVNETGRDIVTYLGDLTSQLTQCKDFDNFFSEILKNFSTLIDTRSISIHRKHYIDLNHFTLETICQYPQKNQSFSPDNEELDSGELSLDCWRKLESGQPVAACPFHLSKLGVTKNIFLIPLFITSRLYGFMAFSDMPEETTPKWKVDTAKTFVSIIELWINKRQTACQLNDLIEFMPYPILGINMDEKVTIWNKAMEQMTGLPAEQILGKGNYEHAIPFYGKRRPNSNNLILNPDSKWEARYIRFVRGRKTVTALNRCDHLPEGGATVASKTGLLYDATERPCGSVHIIQDVTHEREMEENLHRTESFYRTLTDFAGLGIALFAKNGCLLNANDHFCELIDINMDKSLVFDDILERIDKRDRNEIANLFKNMFQGSLHPSRFEFAGSNTDGEHRYFKGYAQIRVFENKKAVHLIIDDITDQKKNIHQKRLNELRMYHSDRLSALGVMAAGVAHELNQPLNAIRVTTDGFLYGRDQGWRYDENEAYDGLELISRQVMRMSKVIKNIRNFSREDRKDKVENASVNLAVEFVFSMFEKQIQANGICLEKILESNLPPVKANKNQMEQVIMNLVVNARQALNEVNKKNKRMWIKTGSCYDQIFIEIGDNAKGISEDLISRIFDPFFTTKPVGKGTGLGLSISQSMVNDFNGQIKAYNNALGGATFFITAPQSETAL